MQMRFDVYKKYSVYTHHIYLNKLHHLYLFPFLSD